jgi:hypothetical protein
MLTPGLTWISVVFLLGVFVLIGGIVRIIWAFRAGSFGKGLLVFAIGGLTLLCGIVLLANPLFASGVLTIMLAVYFIIDGISEIAASFRLRPQPGWGWMLFGTHRSGRIMIWGSSAVRRVVHRHPPWHQAVFRRPDHGHGRFSGALDGKIVGRGPYRHGSGG